LTSRERQVLQGVIDGLSNKELSSRLFMSESTVKNVLQSLFRKYDVRTRSQLVRIGLQQRHVMPWK
jgi:DNA-binding NarL/FixJ family response regulator